MPDFMVLVHESEAASAALAPLETRALLEAQIAYEERLRTLGAYRDGERLRPSAEGRRVGRHAGEPRVELGPFAEPTLGGYYIIAAASLDAALELAEAGVTRGATSSAPVTESNGLRSMMAAAVRSVASDETKRGRALLTPSAGRINAAPKSRDAPDASK